MDPHRKRVLCADDEPDTCTMLSSLLGLINCQVVTAESVSEAWEHITNNGFDLYLLDNWLPGGSGVELCRRIREFDKHTPIVFYSAAAYESDRQQALAAGAQAYLFKPTDIHKLVQTIQDLLGSS